MAIQYTTPGVYIAEENAFPNSVVAVASAVPAFIGHTERAEYQGKSLHRQPCRITSLNEFHIFFGHAPRHRFSLDDKGLPVAPDPLYRLYFAMQMFYENGGGACYVVSAGSYADALSASVLTEAMGTLEKEQEPTLVVVPDAVSLTSVAECAKVQNASLKHCASTQNRFAILDVYDGFKSPGDCIAPFRESITNHLSLGAAYYPWLKSTVVQDSDLSIANFLDTGALKKQLTDEVSSQPENRRAPLQAEIAKLATIDAASDAQRAALHETLSVISPAYVRLLHDIKAQLNLQPPSGAMAGIYTLMDDSRGVWAAPANVGVSAVTAPAVDITHEEQEDLNVPLDGKAVNVIRAFAGRGTLVWGARTLDGNSQDWRYVNVRRTVLMLEASIRQAVEAYVFAPNVANTWVTVKSMLQNFLTGIWKQGGLAGARPEDAFSVEAGLGVTMTADDILDGLLRVTVRLAVTHPAEFIEITFAQQQQSS